MFQMAINRHALMVLLIALVLAPAVASGKAVDANDPPYRVERDAQTFDLTGTVHRVRIDNPHGDIRVRAGRRDRIEILSVKQIIGEKPVAPELLISIDSKHSDDSSIAVKYPRLKKPFYGRIDLVVYLPRETAVELSTVDSVIEVKGGWQGTIDAKSDSGKITADGRNQLRLQSKSGRIVAALLEGKRENDSLIQTRSGSINLAVQKVASVDVYVQTCGKLDSRSHSLENLKEGRCSKATAQFSAGDHRAEVVSRSGEVMIEAM